MKKADYKFYRDKKQAIVRLASQSDEGFWWKSPANSPIHIPRRKKKK